MPLLLLLGSFLLILISNDASSAKSNATESPYFIEGYDVVSYFRESGPIVGKHQYSINYQNQTMLFSSEKNLMDFQFNPELYMPAYNGYCAYGMVYGMKSKIDPLQYDIVEGRLYLQLDRGY